VKQHHTSTATSILTTKSTHRSLSAQRLSERTILLLPPTCFMCLTYTTFAGEIIELLTEIVHFILPSVLSSDEDWPFRKQCHTGDTLGILLLTRSDLLTVNKICLCTNNWYAFFYIHGSVHLGNICSIKGLRLDVLIMYSLFLSIS
jgi:hypothetical protein